MTEQHPLPDQERPGQLRPWKRFKRQLRCRFYRLLHGAPFHFDGADYAPFFHVYNETWINERAVEVPIVWTRVQRCNGRILEVGNVLSHYFPVRHEIVDKYERQPGVINADVLDFNPPQRYDLIISISTLEHVGWDETPRDEEKALRSVEHLKSLLARGGSLMVTLPVGHHTVLDRAVLSGGAGFDRVVCLRRLSQWRWVEVPCEEVRAARYGTPFPCANGLVVATFVRR